MIRDEVDRRVAKARFRPLRKSCWLGLIIPRFGSCCRHGHYDSCIGLVQNTVVEEVQQLPWRLCYARDKAQPAPSAAVSAGADALQARAGRHTDAQALPAVAAN